MNCNNCGAQLKDGASFCHLCGTRVKTVNDFDILEKDDLEYPEIVEDYYAAEDEEIENYDLKASSYSGKALTFGILGFIFCFIPIIGLIFCISAKRNVSKAKEYNGGIAPGAASAGNVLGTIGLIFSIILNILIIGLFIYFLISFWLVYYYGTFYQPPAL